MQSYAAFESVFSGLRDQCPGFQGAVVATRDGLVLAATEGFGSDSIAGVTASLATHLDGDFRIAQAGAVSEVLVWTESGLWTLGRLAAGYLLLIHSSAAAHAGAVRLACQRGSRQLDELITGLEKGGLPPPH